MSTPRDGHRARIERWLGSRGLRATVVIVVVTLVLWRFNLRDILGHFNTDMLVGMILIQPVILAGYCFNAMRFALLVGEPRIPMVIAFKALVLSYGLHALLPARISEIVKATYIRNHCAVPLGRGVAAVFLERVADLIYVGVLSAIGVSFLLSTSYAIAAVLIGAAAATLSLIVVFENALLVAAEKLPWARVRHVAGEFVKHINVCLRTRAFYVALTLGCMVWICACASVMLMLWWAGSIPLGIGGAVTVFIASVIGGAIPALPGGLGTYEAAVAMTLKGLGYGLEQAIAVAIALHAGQLVMSITGAVLILSLDRTGVRELLQDALRQRNTEAVKGT